jgi:TolB-like protein/Tfp pilus assembly protein PilF
MTATRRLAAILAADVAGYSRLMGTDEEGTHELLKAHLGELVDPKIAEHRGRVVKNSGDGFLAEFASVVDAVRCAVELQRGMAEANAATPPEKRIEFRVGINLGDVIAEEHDIFGDGVNVAARLEALAEPGGICVSRVVRDQVRDRLDFGFDDMGERQVKNIARPVHAYRVRLDPSLHRTPLPLPDKPSLAVLPFQNMTGDTEQDYFVDGIVEEITTAISRLPWLFVIARNSSFTYKGRAVDVKQVARDLGVRYILEGSVRKAGNRVRITAQLIDTTTGAHIWADRFDGAMEDIFELQDQVAGSVVGTIEPKLRQSEIKRAVRKPTESLDIYDLYLRALALTSKITCETVNEAIAVLNRALAIDPTYAPAAARLALCRVGQVSFGLGGLSDAEISEATHLAARAIEIGKDDPDTLWMGAHALSFFAREHGMAASAVGRALVLNPNSAHAWMTSGRVACFRNRPDAAIEAFHRAMRLSPLDPQTYQFTGGIAWAHLLAGRYADAITSADRSLDENPRYTPMLRYKLVACAHLGRIGEARELLRKILALEPGLTIAGLKAYPGITVTPEFASICAEGFRKTGLAEE